MSGLDLGGHFGQLELDRLVLRDGLSEGLALLCVGNAQFEGTLCDAAATGSDIHPPDLDSVHHLVKPSAGHPAQDTIGRNSQSVHDELGGIDPLVAHLVDLPGNREPRADLAEARFLLDQERRHRLVRSGALGGVSFVTPAQDGDE